MGSLAKNRGSTSISSLEVLDSGSQSQIYENGMENHSNLSPCPLSLFSRSLPPSHLVHLVIRDTFQWKLLSMQEFNDFKYCTNYNNS